MLYIANQTGDGTGSFLFLVSCNLFLFFYINLMILSFDNNLTTVILRRHRKDQFIPGENVVSI